LKIQKNILKKLVQALEDAIRAFDTPESEEAMLVSPLKKHFLLILHSFNKFF